ncbi:MAG: ABC transporter permease [Chloroflexi bacterium]|nr:ABC transporter permease [Chloroflexota bacterium]
MWAMSLHRLWAIAHKEFRHIQRDKRTLFLVTLSPAIMLIAFAYLFAFEVQSVRLGVWDADQSALSRRYIASLTANGKFTLARQVTGYVALREAMMSNAIHLGIVIPPDFEAMLARGESVDVQVIADGSDAISSAGGVTRLRQRTREFSRQFSDSALPPPITVQAQAWYNRELSSTLAMVPGLVPVVMILPSLAIALALTREKELGSFETLATTPIRGFEYLAGKLLPYIVYGIVSASAAYLMAIIWFRVPLRGPALDLLGMTGLYLFASLGMTLFFSSFLANQGTAMRVVLLIFFIPSFFMAGVVLPVDTRSGAAQIFSFFLPTTHLVQITRGVFLKGLGLPDLVTQSFNMFVLGLVPFILSLLTFRKQV